MRDGLSQRGSTPQRGQASKLTGLQDPLEPSYKYMYQCRALGAEHGVRRRSPSKPDQQTIRRTTVLLRPGLSSHYSLLGYLTPTCKALVTSCQLLLLLVLARRPPSPATRSTFSWDRPAPRHHEMVGRLVTYPIPIHHPSNRPPIDRSTSLSIHLPNLFTSSHFP